MTTRRQLFGLLTGAAALPLVAFEKRADDFQMGSTSWRAGNPKRHIAYGIDARGATKEVAASLKRIIADSQQWFIDDMKRGRYG